MRRKTTIRSVKRRRYDINKRFFVFLGVTAVLIAALLLFFLLPRTSTAKWGYVSEQGVQEAVVAFNEVQIPLQSSERVVFNIPNYSLLNAGDEIGAYYKEGYVINASGELSALEAKINEYQKTHLIKDIFSTELNNLNLEIQSLIKELQSYSINSDSYLSVNRRLIDKMQERQAYIEKEFVPDAQLNEYYTDRNNRLKAIADNKISIAAPSNGYVSWYINPLLKDINEGTLNGLTAETVKKVLENVHIIQNINYNTDYAVRVIRGEYFYLILPEYKNVTAGQSTALYLAGSGQSVPATVYLANNEQKITVYKVSVDSAQALGAAAMLVSESKIFEGLTVPSDFIHSENGAAYIFADQNGKKERVFVRVLCSSEETSAVESIVSGALYPQQRVYSK